MSLASRGSKTITGGIEVSIQDQTSDIVDLYLRRDLGSLSLSSTKAINDNVLNVVSAAGVVAGNMVCLKQDGRFYQGTVLSVNGNDITLDTPLDYAFNTLAVAQYAESNLATSSGTIAAPYIYYITPPSGVKWDVTRVLFHIEDASTMDDGTFGGIVKLTNGIVLRARDGLAKNIFNAKTNGELALRCDEREYVTKPPSGTGYAVNFIRHFTGQDRNGVAIRLDGSKNDALQVLVQDNLTGLSLFLCTLQGHVVE